MHSVGLSLGLSQSFPRHRKHASTGFLLGNNRPQLAVPGRKKAAYLERFNLLTDDERECLPVDAFEPVRYFE